MTKEVKPWLASGGLGHLFHYLLTLDLTGFDPTAPAMMTEDKRNMVSAGQSAQEALCAEFTAASERKTPHPLLDPDLDLYTPGDIIKRLQLRRSETPDYNAERLGHALAALFPKNPGKDGFVHVNREPLRLYALRNIDKWRTERSTNTWIKHRADWERSHALQEPKGWSGGNRE